MTHKEQMLRAARGEWADRLPFAPRLDLWHNANIRRRTLPARYGTKATTAEIADDLGVAHHRIIPEFLKARTPDDTIDRGLGRRRWRWRRRRRRRLGLDRQRDRERGCTDQVRTAAGASFDHARRL